MKIITIVLGEINENSCDWNNKKYEDNNNHSEESKNNNTKNIIQPYNQKECFEEKDPEKSIFIKKYYGSIIYEYKKIENRALSISLKENDQSHGAYTLYCEYSIKNYDIIKSLAI